MWPPHDDVGFVNAGECRYMPMPLTPRFAAPGRPKGAASAAAVLGARTEPRDSAPSAGTPRSCGRPCGARAVAYATVRESTHAAARWAALKQRAETPGGLLWLYALSLFRQRRLLAQTVARESGEQGTAKE